MKSNIVIEQLLEKRVKLNKNQKKEIVTLSEKNSRTKVMFKKQYIVKKDGKLILIASIFGRNDFIEEQDELFYPDPEKEKTIYKKSKLTYQEQKRS